MNLTIQNIQAASPGITLRDDQVRGLHLRVFPNSRAFYLYYRTQTGIERRPKLGSFPAISVTTARQQALRLLGQVAKGQDPANGKQRNRSAPIVRDLAEQYLTEYAEPRKKPKSILEDRRLLDSHILPEIGYRKVTDINFQDMDGLHTNLKETPYQANRVLALLNKMFDLAELWQIRESNPCRHVQRFKEHKRRRHMTADEAPRITAALEKHKAHYPQEVLFIYLLIMTGARKSEIAAAKWKNLEGNRLCGIANKTDDDRPIYLPEIIMSLIRKLPRNGEHLIQVKDPRQLWDKVREEAGCLDLRLHDLRRTFASTALSLGYSLDQIGELLRHKSKDTTSGYAYLAKPVENHVAEQTAAELEKVMRG